MSDQAADWKIKTIDAYTIRMARLNVLIEALESKVFETDEAVPKSIQEVAAFLGDEMRATKAEQTQMIDAEMADGES